MEDHPHTETQEERRARAQRFGAYLTRAATHAGYDVRPRMGGRKRLAHDLGLNLTTVSRTLDGGSIPLPSQMQRWARTLGIDHQEMLVRGGLLPDSEEGNESAIQEVVSRSITPEEAADAWGITDPTIRSMLIGNIRNAVQLQKEKDAAGGRGAVARG
jgi:hypothetical protein